MPKSTYLTIAALALLFVGVSNAHASTLNLDSAGLLNMQTAQSAFPGGLQGFTFDTKTFVVGNAWYDTFFANNIAFAGGGLNALSNYQGAQTVLLTSSQAFNFQSADFASWVSDDGVPSDPFSAVSLTLNGYLNGVSKGTYTVLLNSDGSFTQFNGGSGLNDINGLSVTANAPRGVLPPQWWLMDDFNYQTVVSSPLRVPGAPEPGTLVLVVSGLAGSMMAVRRRLSV